MITQPSTQNQPIPLPGIMERETRDWDGYTAQILARVKEPLGGYEPLSLQELARYALMDRIDHKFVFHKDTLLRVLKSLVRQYRILEIDSNRIHQYSNLYFDTPNFGMFAQHHRQQRVRYKVRCRAYTDTGLTYLEVKRKNSANRTTKRRIETESLVEELPGVYGPLLAAHYPGNARSLTPVLWNQFQRITLVSKNSLERLTLDINLNFSDGWNQVGLPAIAVAEVKQAAFSVRSQFMVQMRQQGVQPQRFSKYCFGIPLFYGTVKANRFKPRLRLVEQIINQGGRNE